MNMLDNAVEGAERTPEGRRKFVRVRLRSSEGFLAVSCVNSFDGRVLPDGRGGLLTTKPEGAHGLGLAQMRAVAEKYSSVLELSRARRGVHRPDRAQKRLARLTYPNPPPAYYGRG